MGAARNAKKDEFYTRLEDIAYELRHYDEHFAGKVVYCNCDDPRISNFYQYFKLNFHELDLKRLITTCYQNQSPDLFSQHDVEQAVGVDYDGATERVFRLEDDGDFRSTESIALLEQSDIVVTNPPFSLFREYIAQLVEHDKKFLVIGSKNAITYKETFSLIQAGKLWLGYGFRAGNAYFKTPYPDEYARGVYDPETKLVKFRNVGWFTNMDHAKRHEKLMLYDAYTPEAYPMYDNYDAIEVSRIANIPKDYDGVMGVPITFLDKYNPSQFEVLGIANSARWIGYECYTVIGGKKIYNRILIRRRK